MANLEAALNEAQALMEIDGVIGVGEGRLAGQPCVTVFVSLRTPELGRRIPKTIQGVPIDVQESGNFTAG